MKRKLALFLVLVLCLTLAVPAFAEETTTEEPLPLDTILIAPAPVIPAVTILYTNDVHSYITQSVRYSTVAAYRDTLENVLLVDAGDHIQGSAYGSMDMGASIEKIMEAVGYDAATLGNHEFDYGMERILSITSESSFPYLSCNFYEEENGVKGELVLAPYKVFEVNGMKIAIVGVTTPESFTKSTPKYFQDEEGNYIYGIAGGTDGAELYAAVQSAIDAASKEADVVIGLGHLGVDISSQPYTSKEVIANTTGLDAFIDGHSHHSVEMEEVADKNGDTVILTQTGNYMKNLGQMSIAADGTISCQLLNADALAEITPDAEVKAVEDEWVNSVEDQLGTVIGSFADEMVNYDGDTRLVRKQETNVGDFCADALYYLFDNMELDVDVAIMNGGGIRNKNLSGEISYKTCKEIHTFGNVACLQTVTGQQILDALEWGARFAGGEKDNGGFLHVSGLKYSIDTSIENTVQMDEKGVWCGGPTGEYRVKDVMVLNKESGEYEALNLEGKYNLAGYNYTLRDLGDGFAMFDGAVNVLDYVMTDYLVLANYVKSFENGVVTGYAQPQGRINIIKKAAFPDVPAAEWYAAPVSFAAAQGLVVGDASGNFNPDASMTLAEYMTVLYRFARASAPLLVPEKETTGENWMEAAQYVNTAMMGGAYTDLSANMTRYEMADITAAAMKLMELAGKTLSLRETHGFTDVEENASVMLLESIYGIDGFLEADGTYTFRGDNEINRAQVAQVLFNIMTKSVK